jgi:hypothetical protein
MASALPTEIPTLILFLSCALAPCGQDQNQRSSGGDALDDCSQWHGNWK